MLSDQAVKFAFSAEFEHLRQNSRITTF